MINSTKDVLKNKDYLYNKLNFSEISFLNENGYCLIPPKKSFWEWIGADLKEIRKIIDKLIEKEGLSAGSEGKEEFTIEKKKKLEPKANRIGNLLNKNVIMKKCATLPEIVWGSYEVIKKDIKLSSILFREPILNSGDQAMHIDWHPRKSKNDSYKDVVTFIYLEDSTKKNGATKLVPKSHKILGYPAEHMNPFKPYEKEIQLEAEAGSILIVNANTWHRGSNNTSGKKRGALVIDYRSRDLKQLLNLYSYIDENVKKEFNEIETYLFGLRGNDTRQEEKTCGPGEAYRIWLEKNSQFNYSLKK